MTVTMVKKQLESGEPCGKCAQAEELLKKRGLWDRIDEVVWAIEGDADSAGMKLGAQHGVDIAPFFLVDEGDGTTVYKSVIKLAKDLAKDDGPAPKGAHDADTDAEADRLDDRPPWEILKWGLERHGADCAIAFSGAEDVVLIHMAAETGLPFSVFCLDTGRLHPETYRFIDKVRSHYGIEIAVMTPRAKSLEAFVRDKGLFSFYEDGHGECCGIRKVEPLRRALRGRTAWATGQRKDQSPSTRSDLRVVEVDATHTGKKGNLIKLNPLANWSSARVWQYIRGNEIPFNALHEKGFVSIGCEPCTRAIVPGEHERAGRWWWEDETKRECGLHIVDTKLPGARED